MVWTNQIHPPYFEIPNYKNREIRDADRHFYNRVQRSRLAIADTRELLKFVDRVLSADATIFSSPGTTGGNKRPQGCPSQQSGNSTQDKVNPCQMGESSFGAELCASGNHGRRNTQNMPKMRSRA